MSADAQPAPRCLPGAGCTGDWCRLQRCRQKRAATYPAACMVPVPPEGGVRQHHQA